jgi:hypothetical protein
MYVPHVYIAHTSCGMARKLLEVDVGKFNRKQTCHATFEKWFGRSNGTSCKESQRKRKKNEYEKWFQ